MRIHCGHPGLSSLLLYPAPVQLLNYFTVKMMRRKMSTTRAKGPFPLSNLPEELRGYYMYPRSPLSELALLAQTSKKYEAETASLRLLAAAIHAAPKPLPVKEEAKEDVTALAALTILKRHPELLFEKRGLTIRDSHDREFEASPYQIFLGAGDVWAHRQI